jgi:hypothetical protein
LLAEIGLGRSDPLVATELNTLATALW